MDELKELAGKTEINNLRIDEVIREIDTERDYVVSPPSFFLREEFSTANRIEKELNSFGLETRRVDGTGVNAEIKGCGEGKTIILRADIDALPVEETNGCSFRSKNKGVMHACGHDAHTASLLLAAKILSKHRDEFKGTVKLCFQQAEKIGYGAMEL